MESAVDDALDDETTSDALADAARICLRDAVVTGDERGAALHLLAGDALLTYACDAAAVDGDIDKLRELARSWSPARLANLLASYGAR
jgi:hypothetical protein